MTGLRLRHGAITRIVRQGAWLLIAGLLSAGSPLIAVEPVQIRSADVVLSPDGLLRGTVLNSAAQPVTGVKVRVLHDEQVVATATSNDKGEFSVNGLRNGAHVVAAGTTARAVRLWNKVTAPPAAVETLAIAVDEGTVRGQTPESPPGAFFTSGSGALLAFGGAVAVTLGTTLSSDNTNTATSSDGDPHPNSGMAFDILLPASP